MTTELNEQTLQEALVQIVDTVFGTMVSLEVSACQTPWFHGGDRLIAAVHMMGAWNGALLMECDRGLACRIAGRFLSMDPPIAVDDDVRDVLGELANMVGGNLKSVMTPGIRLSLPSVVDGGDYSVRFCGTQIDARVSFHCDEGPFWITVLRVETSGLPS
jgi:chemotaxis protein CheX